MSVEERSEIVNKCGPSGLMNEFIPNSLLGLDITESCNIHDYEFHLSQNEEDHRKVDNNFLHNMNNQIDRKKSWLNVPRKILANLYFYAVRIYSSFSRSS